MLWIYILCYICCKRPKDLNCVAILGTLFSCQQLFELLSTRCKQSHNIVNPVDIIKGK